MAKAKGIKSRLKKDGDFIPPDGGWGWMIVLAAGVSNLSSLPMLQQFGLLFRDRLAQVGVSGSALTTIINMQSALTSCGGLANGPVFKTFSYRAVSLTGAIIVFLSLLLTTFSYNFATYLISFSILYGSGYGLISSANALALNTYWKKRRRLATSLAWTTTGLGPILWPQIFKFFLFPTMGARGTTLFLSGFSLHAIAGALLLQPVEWHSKSLEEKEKEIPIEPDVKESQLANDKKNESGYFSQKLKNLSVFSSQYLYNEDDHVNTGYEITDPGVPMMVRANDGYFSQSRQSLRSRLPSTEGSNKNSRLNSKKPSMTNLTENRSRKSSTLYLNESKKNSSANLGALTFERESGKKAMPNLLESKSRKSSTLYLNESKKNSAANLGALAQERETYKPKRKISITDIQIPESEIEDCPTLKAPQDLKADEKAVLEQIDPEKEKNINDRAEKHLTNSKRVKTLKVPVETPYGELYNRDNHSNISYKNYDDNDERKYFKDNQSNQSYRTTRQRRKSNNFNFESEVLKQASLKLEQYLKEKDEDTDQKLKLLMSTDLDDDVFENDVDKTQVKQIDEEDEEEEFTLWQKIVLFFDLDLLKDFTFINLMLGITLANFNELNFSILTPFLLGNYGLSPAQISDFMSILAGIDVGVRFCIPFVAGKIGWDNNSFFLFGVVSMAMGRVVLSFSQDYWVVIIVACIIGFGKGLRTVFMALVIPTHVPLHKLPGATGLQLLSAGIAYIALGPVVGWIFESASTEVTLHCLNIFTWLTALSWGLEKYIRSKRQNESNQELVAA